MSAKRNMDLPRPLSIREDVISAAISAATHLPSKKKARRLAQEQAAQTLLQLQDDVTQSAGTCSMFTNYFNAVIRELSAHVFFYECRGSKSSAIPEESHCAVYVSACGGGAPSVFVVDWSDGKAFSMRDADKITRKSVMTGSGVAFGGQMERVPDPRSKRYESYKAAEDQVNRAIRAVSRTDDSDTTAGKLQRGDAGRPVKTLKYLGCGAVVEVCELICTKKTPSVASFCQVRHTYLVPADPEKLWVLLARETTYGPMVCAPTTAWLYVDLGSVSELRGHSVLRARHGSEASAQKAREAWKSIQAAVTGLIDHVRKAMGSDAETVLDVLRTRTLRDTIEKSRPGFGTTTPLPWAPDFGVCPGYRQSVSCTLPFTFRETVTNTRAVALRHNVYLTFDLFASIARLPPVAYFELPATGWHVCVRLDVYVARTLTITINAAPGMKGKRIWEGVYELAFATMPSADARPVPIINGDVHVIGSPNDDVILGVESDFKNDGGSSICLDTERHDAINHMLERADCSGGIFPVPRRDPSHHATVGEYIEFEDGGIMRRDVATLLYSGGKRVGYYDTTFHRMSTTDPEKLWTRLVGSEVLCTVPSRMTIETDMATGAE